MREARDLQQLLLELTARDVLRDADSKSKIRAKPLSSEILRMRGNVVSMRTTSGTTRGKHWNQTIQLLGLRKALDKFRGGKSTLMKALVQAIKFGDVKVHCTCPAYKWWGYAYISTQLGYKFSRKQNIFPKIRNPSLRGTVCKHLINALGALPFNVPSLVKRARKAGIA